MIMFYIAPHHRVNVLRFCLARQQNLRPFAFLTTRSVTHTVHVPRYYERACVFIMSLQMLARLNAVITRRHTVDQQKRKESS